MAAARHKIKIYPRLGEVGSPPDHCHLYLSGFTIVTYFGLRLRPGTLSRAREAGSIRIVTGDNSYEAKTSSVSSLQYSEFLQAGLLPDEFFISRGADRNIYQSLAWTDPEYALVVIPLNFSTGDSDLVQHPLLLDSPAGVEEVLHLQKLVTRSAIVAQLAEQSVQLLTGLGVLAREDIIAVAPMTDSMGIQLWDLDGSLRSSDALRPTEPYSAVAESRKYAWEISSFMAYPVDHVIEDHLWRQRSPDQVFNEVAEGYTMLGDHIVFLSHCCCLEISHLPFQLKERSQFRMLAYGYDSSALYIWGIANLRTFIIADLKHRYHSRIADLLESDDLTAGALTDLAKMELQHDALIDQLVHLPDRIREERLREIDREVFRLRYARDPVEPLRRDMERAQLLASDLVKARNQALQERGNMLLAVLTAALATLGIPALVEQFASWFATGQSLRPAVAICGLVGVLVALYILSRRKK